jgi:hypothetical protein
MIQGISISVDDMKEILDALPEEMRKNVVDKIKPYSVIGRIQEFFEQYADDDIRDHIIAITFSNLIGKIFSVSTEMIKERKAEGKGRINTIDMGQIVIKCLNDEAKHIQSVLDSQTEDCGAKN